MGGKGERRNYDFKLVARFESSEVQYLSFNSLFSVATSKKHSLGNHGGGRTCAKKSLNLPSAPLKQFEPVC